MFQVQHATEPVKCLFMGGGFIAVWEIVGLIKTQKQNRWPLAYIGWLTNFWE